ncbi:MAG TPA: glycosyltransferase family 9 protein [Pyrinomonadaceae bacterium]|nr:glycosyltransferase family 9 protein [Pyrinomonadaceae bacterium]
MHILIVKLGSIGDIVHTLPSLAAIREHRFDAEISWVVEERSAEILRGNTLIDNLIEIDTRSLRGGKVIEEILLDASKQVNTLRKHKFDLAIDFQGLMKSGLVARVSGAKTRFGFAKHDLRESGARIFYTDVVDAPTKTHVIRKLLALAGGALNIPVQDGPFEFPISVSPEHTSEADLMIETAGSEQFAILNPGGGWVTKLWHAEKFGMLADALWERLGLVSIITTGTGEIGLAEKAVASSTSGRGAPVQPSLKGFYEMARRARVYVGGDTGPTHIAIAARAPVVGLFGPTEWWRNGSTNPDDICVERTDIKCRIDCNRRTCSNWICMDSDVETVFAAVARRLQWAEPVALAGSEIRPAGSA